LIQLKDVGNFKSIPQIASDIINGDTIALDKHFEQGWDIESEIELSKHIKGTPLYLALLMESFDSVKWLINHGVNLNDRNKPSFLVAVRYCNEDIIRYLVKHGADINAINNVNCEAFEEAMSGKKLENLPLINELGHTVEKFGGAAFRSTISKIGFDRLTDKDARDDMKYEALDFFIKNGVDINYNKADDVHSYESTPICASARYVDIDMCKYLVKHGADITICESDGMRPYNIAVKKGDKEMANYFKSLEPVDFHDMQNKLLELKSYKLPKPLMEFLQSDSLRVEFEHDEDGGWDIPYVEFFSLIDTVPTKVEKRKLLLISKETGEYSHIQILWNPKDKCISYYDISHKEFGNIATFDVFINDMGACLQKAIFDEES